MLLKKSLFSLIYNGALVGLVGITAGIDNHDGTAIIGLLSGILLGLLSNSFRQAV